MKIKTITTALIASLFAMTSSFAMNIDFSDFNASLSAAERSRLENGEVLIKKLSNTKQLSMSGDNKFAQEAVKTAKALKPAYLSEIIKVIPVEGNENLISTLRKEIMNVESYAGIPYWSEHNQQWFELYSSAKIVTKNSDASKDNVTAELEMQPFGKFNMLIDCVTDGDSIYYTSTNIDKMKYQGITCVNSYNMKSLICAYKKGDNWILYGIGAVSAPDVFFLRDRIELSFMNRIKTFCQFFFKKL